jgi:Ca2+-binding RTX toxin-like protein
MARNLYGTDNSEILHGTSGHSPDGDAIWGYGGDDEIYAGDGLDYLTGGFGADYLDGGNGLDQAIYKDSPVGVTVFLSPGLGFGGTAEGDVLVNIEDLAGSEYNDVLSGDGSANWLFGRAGNDTLKGGGGWDRLAGDAGNDILMGGADGDYMHGGTGFDTASYEGSSTGVSVSLITDSALRGDAQGDTLYSIENLTGSRHADNLLGDNGANVLNGLDGHDTLKGYGGADSLAGGIGDDILIGGDGMDTLRGDQGADTTKGEKARTSTSSIRLPTGRSRRPAKARLTSCTPAAATSSWPDLRSSTCFQPTRPARQRSTWSATSSATLSPATTAATLSSAAQTTTAGATMDAMS